MIYYLLIITRSEYRVAGHYLSSPPLAAASRPSSSKQEDQEKVLVTIRSILLVSIRSILLITAQSVLSVASRSIRCVELRVAPPPTPPSFLMLWQRPTPLLRNRKMKPPHTGYSNALS